MKSYQLVTKQVYSYYICYVQGAATFPSRLNCL